MNAEPRTPKFPHMSLCYIDDADAQMREQVATNALVQGLAVDVDGGGGVSLRYGQQPEEFIQGFDCRDIWIMECGPNVQEWRALEKVHFDRGREA